MIDQQTQAVEATILTNENFESFQLSRYITQDAINLLSIFGFDNQAIVEIVSLISSFKYQQCVEKVSEMQLAIKDKRSNYVPIQNKFITIANAYCFDPNVMRGQCMDMSFVVSDLLMPYIQSANSEKILGSYKIGMRIRNGRSSLFFSELGSNHVWVELYLSKNSGFTQFPNHLILDPAFQFIRSSLPKYERVDYEELMAHSINDRKTLINLQPCLEVGQLIQSPTEPSFLLKDMHFIGLACDGTSAISISFLYNGSNQIVPMVRLKDLSYRNYFFFLDSPVGIDLSIVEFEKFVSSSRAQGYPELSYLAQKEAKEILFILNQKLNKI